MTHILRLTAAPLLAAIALTACGKKAETPAADSAAVDASADANTGAGTASASPQRTPHTINTGDPVDGDATLAAPATAPAGSVIEVDWTGPGNATDYIDIVRRGYTPTSGETSYVYIRNAEITGKLPVPTLHGDYDIRYIADLRGGRVVKATIPLTVTPVAVAFDAPPETASGGEPLRISWTGPDNRGDYVDIVRAGHTATSGEITYAYTSAGSPSEMKAPGAAGDYLIRYIMEGRPQRVVAATTPLTITAAEATLDAPSSATKGAPLQVTWTGPDRSGDYVDLVPKGYTATSGELAYFYTRNGSPGTLKAPDRAGEFEIRYLLEAPGGRQILATTPLKVE